MTALIRIRVAAFSMLVFGVGCATTGRPPAYSDGEMELAQQRAENETLARLAASNNNDIADAATTLSHERAPR